MYNMYKCNIEQIVYPFYIIKKNLGIIPIDEEYDLSNRLEREGYIFKNNELLGNEDFNVYIPTYSKIIKATSQKKTKTNSGHFSVFSHHDTDLKSQYFLTPHVPFAMQTT